MSEDNEGIIYAKTRDFREKLREYIEIVRFGGKTVIVQSNKKNVAVLISYERWTNLRKKAGEAKEDSSKQLRTHRRPSVEAEPSMCVLEVA